MANQQNRIVWLDWMKVLAILSIIWGHFFSQGYQYLYVFNVQVFCVISGFLYHPAPNWRTCLVRNARQLLVPTAIFSIVMQLEAYLRSVAEGTAYDVPPLWYLENLLLGHRWCMGPCWFFYTFFLIRLLMQQLPRRWWVYLGLLVVSGSAAVALHREQWGAVMLTHSIPQNFESENAWTNVLVCLPPFAIGLLLQPLKGRLVAYRQMTAEVPLLIVAVLLVWLCGRYNGEVWMYLCGYGNHFVWFLVGTIAGTSMLFVLSLWLNRLPYTTMVDTLSRGSILIVGLHIIIVRRLMELPDRFLIEDLFFSLFILMAFYPLIRLVQRYTPWLMGQIR